jgi:hypothetical protein
VRAVIRAIAKFSARNPRTFHSIMKPSRHVFLPLWSCVLLVEWSGDDYLLLFLFTETAQRQQIGTTKCTTRTCVQYVLVRVVTLSAACLPCLSLRMSRIQSLWCVSTRTATETASGTTRTTAPTRPTIPNLTPMTTAAPVRTWTPMMTKNAVHIGKRWPMDSTRPRRTAKVSITATLPTTRSRQTLWGPQGKVTLVTLVRLFGRGESLALACSSLLRSVCAVLD